MLQRLLTLRKLLPLLGFWGLLVLITKKITGQTLIQIRLHNVPVPLWARTNNSDLSVLYQIFGEQECAVELDHPPAAIIDGGANVGYASVYLALRYPQAAILAVEPNDENCQIFKRNCSPFPNIRLLQGAIWHTRTDLEITNPVERSWMIRVQETSASGRGRIPSFTIDDLLAQLDERPVDILKLDIEGAENELFSEGDLAWIDRVHCLIIEAHGGAAKTLVVGAMESRGFGWEIFGEKLVFRKMRSRKQDTRETKPRNLPRPRKERFTYLDLLRGIAACSVAWFHVVQNNPRAIQNEAIYQSVDASSKYGFLGVTIFFVISGFIIPHSMAIWGYRLRDYFLFLWKRLLRLQIPFYASILIALIVGYAAPHFPGFAGEKPDFTWPQVIAHILYLNPLTGHEWVMGIYWTLSVEFQYYLLIGLLMPIFLEWRQAWTLGILLGLDCLPFCSHLPSLQSAEVSNGTELSCFPHSASFFAVGILLWLFSCKRFGRRLFAGMLAITLGCVVLQYPLSYVIAVILVIPIFIWPPPVPKLFIWLGTISYSVYLVHYIVGMRFSRLLMRFCHSDAERVLAYLGAFVISIACSALFFWMIERPSLRLSGKVRFGLKRTELNSSLSAQNGADHLTW
jgi:FkbM family methyltransferase